MTESTKATLDEWRRLACKELKGADPGSLTWHTLEGIEVKPLYTEADVNGLDHLGSLPGIEPFTRGPRATMYAGRPGPSGNMPAFPPPRNRTPFIARRWRPGSRASRSPSTWRRIAAMTATIRGSRATWARPASPSTASRT